MSGQKGMTMVELIVATAVAGINSAPATPVSWEIVAAAGDSATELKAAEQVALGDHGDYSHDLAPVMTAVPATTSITSLEIDRDRIIVRGATDSVFTAVAYATALEAALFREVRISGLDETPPPATGAGEPGNTAADQLITFEITVSR